MNYFVNVQLQDLFHEVANFVLITVMSFILTQRELSWQFKTRKALYCLAFIYQLNRHKVVIQKGSDHKRPQITSKQPQTTDKQPQIISKRLQTTIKRPQTTNKQPQTATLVHQTKEPKFLFIFPHPIITRTTPILKNIGIQ